MDNFDNICDLVNQLLPTNPQRTSTESRKNPFSDLPFDLILEIALNLDPKDILKLESVCKFFRNTFQKEDERIWKPISLRECTDWFSQWSSNKDNVIKTWKRFFWTQARGFFFPSPNTLLGGVHAGVSDIPVEKIIEVSSDRRYAKVKNPQISGTLGHHRIILLQPAIPNTGTHYVSLKIPFRENGLWIGACTSGFQLHHWLGAQNVSYGIGSHCPDSAYFNDRIISIPKLTFLSGDTVSMEINRKTNELHYYINRKKIETALDLNKLFRTEGDKLHFAVSFWVKQAEVQILSRGETNRLLFG